MLVFGVCYVCVPCSMCVLLCVLICGSCVPSVPLCDPPCLRLSGFVCIALLVVFFPTSFVSCAPIERHAVVRLPAIFSAFTACTLCGGLGERDGK